MTIATTGVAIQARTAGRVLLIDSDLENAGLTYRTERVGQSGLTDIVNGGNTLKPALRTTSNDKIDFMPIGEVEIESADLFKQAVKKMLPKLTGVYDYVFVNVGDAHGVAAECWSGYANGSYLLVSLVNSNQTIARSAVSHLRSFGARLLGCIVSDVEDQ